jgi:tryptophan 2,3-dioxygenase
MSGQDHEHAPEAQDPAKLNEFLSLKKELVANFYLAIAKDDKELKDELIRHAFHADSMTVEEIGACYQEAYDIIFKEKEEE